MRKISIVNSADPLVAWRAARGWMIACGLVAAFGVFWARHPAALLHATFWAEDGWVWYPDAYSMGIRSLMVPHSGYLQLFPRLVALGAQILPLAWAPLLFAGVAVWVQLLVVASLLSRHLDGSRGGGMAWRAGFCALYVMLPNSVEVFGNVTNGQWHVAVLALLVLVSRPPAGLVGWVVDSVTLIISGLSGPFCLMLAPIAAIDAWRHRTRAALARCALVGLCCVMQGFELLATHHAARPRLTLGASLSRLGDVVGHNVVLGAIIGFRQTADLLRTTLLPAHAMLGVAATGLLICGAGILRGPALLRAMAAFAALELGAALLTPVGDAAGGAWAALGVPGAYQRYFFIPMLVVLGALLTLALDGRWTVRGVGIAGLAAGLTGIVADWSYPPWAVTDFTAVARYFDAAPCGTTLAFAVYPPGATPMVLAQRAGCGAR